MKHPVIGLLFLLVMAVAVTAQPTTVNNSRSNIKNNIAVTQGNDGKLRCTAPGGAPCTKDQVNRLASATYSTTKSNIKHIALAPDGSITCEAKDGKPCTQAHLNELNKSAAAMNGANDPVGGVGVGLGKNKDKSR